MPEEKKRLGFVISAILIFILLSIVISFAASLFIDEGSFGNTALIPIKGVITIDGAAGFGESATSSSDLVELIKEADQKDSIKVIVFEINSPGGTPVASREIANAIKRTNKTTIAVIREVGASGAYWIASATDYIISDELSITGSIGVIGSYIEFAGLLDRYNMTYQRLTAGSKKDLGDPFRSLGLDERNIIQKKIDLIHDSFIEAVAENRGMSEEQIRQLATGEFYLGIEALELGLVDELGDKRTAEEYIKTNLGIKEVKFAKYKSKVSFIESFTGVFSPQSFTIGQGIGSELKKVSPRKIEIMT